MKHIISIFCLLFSILSLHPMQRDGETGRTPLMNAARNGRNHLIADLIQREGVHLVDNYGWTALMYAAYWNHPAIVAQLLAAGAHPDVQANDGSTALMDAACNWAENNEPARLLIRAGANVNLADESSWTALMYAARSRSADTVLQLIQARANLNAQDGYYKTPLMIAAQYGSFASVRALRQAGANPHLQDWLWRTALTYAESYDREHNGPRRMVDFLLNPDVANPVAQRVNWVPVENPVPRVEAPARNEPLLNREPRAAAPVRNEPLGDRAPRVEARAGNEPLQRQPVQITSTNNWSVAKYLLAVGAISGLAYIIHDKFFKETEMPSKKQIKNRRSPAKVSWWQRIDGLDIETKIAAALSVAAIGVCTYLAFKKNSVQLPIQHPMNVGIQIPEIPVVPAPQQQLQPEPIGIQPAQQQDAPVARPLEAPAVNPVAANSVDQIPAQNQLPYEEMINNYYGADNSEDSSGGEDEESLFGSLYGGITRVLWRDDALQEEPVGDHELNVQPSEVVQQPSPRDIILQMDEQFPEENDQELIPNDGVQRNEVVHQQPLPNDDVVILLDEPEGLGHFENRETSEVF